MRKYATVLISVLLAIWQSAVCLAAESDFVGQWRGTYNQIEETWTISNDGGKWAASVVYVKGGEQAGASHGEDFQLSGNDLRFIRVIDKKVDEKFFDRQHCKFNLHSDGKLKLEIKNPTGNGVFTKTLTRVEGAVATTPPVKVVAEGPKATSALAVEPPKPVGAAHPVKPNDALLTLENYNRVQVGMSREDLDALLGASRQFRHIQRGQQSFGWHKAGDSAHQIEVIFEKGKVVSKSTTMQFPVQVATSTPPKLGSSTVTSPATQPSNPASVQADGATRVATNSGKPNGHGTGNSSQSAHEFHEEKFVLARNVAAVQPAADLPLGGHVQDIRVSANGKRMLVSYVNKAAVTVEDSIVVGCYDTATRKLLWEQKGLGGKNTGSHLSGLALSGDGSQVAVYSAIPTKSPIDDWQVLFFNGNTGQPITALNAMKLVASDPVYHPTKPVIALVQDQAGRVRLVDLSTGKELWSVSNLRFPQHPEFSPTGDMLAVTQAKGAFGRSVMLYDTATGKLLNEFIPPKGGYRAIAFSPDGKSLAALQDSNSKAHVDIYNVDTHELMIQIFEGVSYAGAHHPLVYTPDGKSIALGCKDSHIHILDVATGKTTGVITKAFWGENYSGLVHAMYLTAEGPGLVVELNLSNLRFYRLADALPYPPPTASGPAEAPFTPDMIPKQKSP